jgi:hypothetical protein
VLVLVDLGLVDVKEGGKVKRKRVKNEGGRKENGSMLTMVSTSLIWRADMASDLARTSFSMPSGS